MRLSWFALGAVDISPAAGRVAGRHELSADFKYNTIRMFMSHT